MVFSRDLHQRFTPGRESPFMNIPLVSPAGRVALHELIWFGRQQLLACVFGILLLLGLFLTKSWDPGTTLARADFLFLYAPGLQIALTTFRFEHRDEIVVIFAFHFLATLMEWFKTSPTIGSWQYPDEGAIFRVYQVPLSAGFLYSWWGAPSREPGVSLIFVSGTTRLSP